MMTEGSNTGSRCVDDELGPYRDAADRLERSIERQISIIDGIDDKAEHLTRLVGVLLGLVFTVLSLLLQLNGITEDRLTVPVQFGFAIGVFFLLLAMASAIITYLSSKFRIGLHHNVGYYLSQPDTTTTQFEHIRRVLGSYGSIVQQNRRVIETNSRRFRFTLYFLLTGVIFLSVAGTMYVGQPSHRSQWLGFGLSAGCVALAAWYILGSKYLTLDG